MTNESNPLARLTLERLARTPADWVVDAKCLDAGIDMMDATEQEMKKNCGSCIVREQCTEGAHEGDTVRAGPRGGNWMSRRTEQRT